MSFRSPLLLVIVASALLASCSARHPGTATSTSVAVSGPMVIGYFPGVTDKEMTGDTSFIAARDQLEQAIAKCNACFGPKGVSAKMVRANAISITDGDSVATIQPGLTADGIGAYIVSPGREATAIQGGAGTVLSTAVPAAASKYFGLPNCQ